MYMDHQFQFCSDSQAGGWRMGGGMTPTLTDGHVKAHKTKTETTNLGSERRLSDPSKMPGKPGRVSLQPGRNRGARKD